MRPAYLVAKLAVEVALGLALLVVCVHGVYSCRQFVADHLYPAGEHPASQVTE